jgi:GMP synthase (glutamine-hydrolysing)
MVLVVNCIADLEDRERFCRGVVPRLAEISGRPVRVVNLEQLEAFVPDPRCTHVVVSGSELSAARQLPTDRALIALIRQVVDQSRVVLGICYGHQMVARALVGDHACRRAEIPEFGFKTVSLAPNPLFAGIDVLTPVHSHCDEVTGLPSDRFDVIASTDHCAVQAWQLRGHTVWGVQFHPELDERLGRELLKKSLETEDGARDHFVDELEGPSHVEAGRRLLENFFRTPPTANQPFDSQTRQT